MMTVNVAGSIVYAMYVWPMSARKQANTPKGSQVTSKTCSTNNPPPISDGRALALCGIYSSDQQQKRGWS